jgi:Lrp/AsnC family transcriptional regulator of ectoine degradation
MARVKLDTRDLLILSILSRDGRLSKTELAKRVNLSATPCWERLKRQEEAGIITGYRAEVSLRDLGPHVEIFLVAELENHRAATFQAFERVLSDYPEITDAWALGGGVDYLIRVVTRDIDSYQRLVDSLLDRRTGLSKYFTYIVTKAIKTGGLPPLDDLFGTGPDGLQG